MKTKLILILLTISFTTVAQDKFSYSFMGGLDFSMLRNDGWRFEDPFSTQTGLLIGFQGAYQIGNRSSVLGGLFYEKKGAKTNFGEIENPSTGLYFGANGSIKLDYLTIPVLYKYDIGEGSLAFYLNAGPFIGILIHSEYDSNLISEFKTIDSGITAGAGFDFKMNDKHSIFLEGRYNIGLVDISEITAFGDRANKSVSGALVLGFRMH